MLSTQTQILNHVLAQRQRAAQAPPSAALTERDAGKHATPSGGSLQQGVEDGLSVIDLVKRTLPEDKVAAFFEARGGV